jgi:hypothetical protein
MDSLVKIAAKYLMNKHNGKIKNLVQDTTEFAVGTKYATAKIGTRLLTEIKKNEGNHDFAIMSIDIKAAYPTASRQHMLKETNDKIPELVDIFNFIYGASNTHHIQTNDGTQEFQQEWGLIQGAENSAFFFSLLTQSQLDDDPQWIECLMRYADDFFLYGDIHTLLDKYQILKTKYAEIGLNLAPEKTKLYMPHATLQEKQDIHNSLPEDIQQVIDLIETQGLKILGIPIGDDQWMKTKLSGFVQQYQSELEIIKSSCTHQQMFKVLQLAASVFQHIIAVIPPEITNDFCKQIDETNIQMFNQLYIPENVQLTDEEEAWLTTRRQLPVRHHGLGILALQHRNSPAYISTAVAIFNDKATLSTASWTAYTESPMQQYLDTAMDQVHQWRVDKVISYNQTASQADQQPLPTKSQLHELAKQKMEQWMQPLFEGHVKQLKANANPLQLQLLTAMENKATRIILTAWPNRPATRLGNEQMKHAICHRLGVGLKELLGMDIESYETKCLACRSGKLTAEHMNSCRSTRIIRHDTIVACTQEMLEDAGIYAVMEKRVGTANHVGERKKIDIWFRNQMPMNATQLHVMADVTVIQAFSTTNSDIPDTVKEMKTAAARKRSKYADEAHALSAQVQPLVFNTLGAMHNEVDNFIKGMAKFAEQNQTYYPSVNLNFNVKWRQNFAFQIARSTANAAYNAMRSHSFETSMLSYL